MSELNQIREILLRHERVIAVMDEVYVSVLVICERPLVTLGLIR